MQAGSDTRAMAGAESWDEGCSAEAGRARREKSALVLVLVLMLVLVLVSKVGGK